MLLMIDSYISARAIVLSPNEKCPDFAVNRKIRAFLLGVA